MEGSNLIIEYRWADGDVARLPELAVELVRQNVDLIVAPNTAAAVAAKNATSNIPVVMMFPSEPVQLKLVSSLRQPGGNVTGTTFTAGPGFFGKLLETYARLRGETSQRLRLAAPSAILRDHLPKLLEQHRRAFPQLRLSLYDANQGTAENMLRKIEVDLAITELEGRPTECIRCCELL